MSYITCCLVSQIFVKVKKFCRHGLTSKEHLNILLRFGEISINDVKNKISEEGFLELKDATEQAKVSIPAAHFLQCIKQLLF